MKSLLSLQSLRSGFIQCLPAFFIFLFPAIYSQETSEYKYFIGIEEPAADWMNPEFIDSGWEVGNGSIGYGDGDDTTLIDTTVSVYLRYSVDISSQQLGQIKAIILNADFDDGYVAYLNGIEILRVNIEDSVEHPGYIQTTCRSHEAVNYTGVYRTFNGYYIDSLKLQNSNLDTINTLAIQVCNDSIKGSDLSFHLAYYFVENDYVYDLYWSECRFTNPICIDSSGLPIVIIETDEFAFNYREERIAHMGVVNNGSGNYNKPKDAFTDYDGYVRINQRGQTSIDFPKVSFRIETQDSVGNNVNVSLLEMPEENDWILYGPFIDKSLIRNEFIFSLGRKMGYYEPRTRFCEVIMNGRNMGLYILTEKIKRDKNRVNIAELHPDENDSIDVTGGYLFRYDKTLEGTIEVIYPKEDEISPAQSQYIEGFIENSEEAILSANFADTVSGYRKFIDDQSLIDYMIINELSKNIDAYFYSCYMYKDRDDRDGRIKYGPLWDYDFSLGYSLWGDLETSGWQFEERSYLSLSRILQDTSFVHALADRWHSLREELLRTDSIYTLIDSIVGELNPYIDRNYQVWPIIQYDYSFAQPINSGHSYVEEIEKMKSWIDDRTTWIDQNIDDIYYPVISPEYIPLTVDKTSEYFYCYPNPFREFLKLEMNLESPGDITFEVRDISGRLCLPVMEEYLEAGRSEIQLPSTAELIPGMYILYAYKNKQLFACQRISKTR